MPNPDKVTMISVRSEGTQTQIRLDTPPTFTPSRPMAARTSLPPMRAEYTGNELRIEATEYDDDDANSATRLALVTSPLPAGVDNEFERVWKVAFSFRGHDQGWVSDVSIGGMAVNHNWLDGA